MPHRSSEEKIEALTSSSENLCRQVLQEHFCCNNSNPKRKTLKYLTQILLLYNLLTKGSSLHKNTKVNNSWLYFSHVKKGFLCKYCELFGVSSSVSPFINKGVDLGTHPTRTLATHNLMRTNVINLLLRGILFVKQIQMSTDS